MTIDVRPKAIKWLEEDCHRDPHERAEVRAKFGHVFETMAEFGPNVGPPHTDKLDDSLWEARVGRPTGAYRLFYDQCPICSALVVTGGLVKKKPRLHPQEMKTAPGGGTKKP